MIKNILIVGGTSGVGLALAKHYVGDGHTVCITGRQNPNLKGAQFIPFNITDHNKQLVQSIEQILSQFQSVNTLIYAAGFRQHHYIDELSDSAIQQMLNTGLTAPALLIKRLKNNLTSPLKVMLITSHAQHTANEYEPIYGAVKAGLGMFGASLVKDKAIGKVLVAAPSPMNTAFWRDSDEDTSKMLDPEWVCDKIVELSSGSFKYKSARILNDPARVEIDSTLDNELNPI